MAGLECSLNKVDLLSEKNRVGRIKERPRSKHLGINSARRIRQIVLYYEKACSSINSRQIKLAI
jgi:hypothetical protein